MARHTSYVGALTIANGGTASNVLAVPLGKMSIALVIVSPAALTGAVALQGNFDGHPTAVVPLAVDTTAITIAANQGKRVNISGVQAVKAVSGSAEGAQRVFQVYAEFDV